MSHKLALDVDDLKRLYIDELKSLEEIAQMKGTSRRSIANWLIRAGVQRRGYDTRYNAALNKSIIEYLLDWKNQTPYIVGYIYADGSIDALNERSKGVSLACVLKDREIIDGIARELKITDKVCVHEKPPSVILGKYHYGARSMCRLRFYSNHVVALLAEYGIAPRKTWLDYPLPDVPQEGMPHFIRGVFDGDGWASHRFNKKYGEQISFGFLGPELFLTQLRDFLVDTLDLPANKVVARPGHFSVAWTTSTAASKMYHYLYPDGSYIYLARKRILLRQMSESQKGRGEHPGRFTKGHSFHPRRKKGAQSK